MAKGRSMACSGMRLHGWLSLLLCASTKMLRLPVINVLSALHGLFIRIALLTHGGIRINGRLTLLHPAVSEMRAG